MKKRLLSLLFMLALCLGLLPATALAAGEDAPGTLWVGQTQITASGYWKTNDDGTLTTEGASAADYSVYYDGSGTLTLNNAKIQGRGDSGNPQPEDYGIYAAPTGNQSVSLTINLMGSNTVSGYCGICVETTTADNASLVIQPAENDPQGSLEAIGNKYNGITISSGSGNASLTINNAPVVAISKSPAPNSYHGVCIKTGNATAPALSLLVNGGSLTAQGESGYGIYFYMGYRTTDPSTSLTVQNNALVKATPSIVTSNNLSKPDTTAGSESGGIVFDGKNGTVYGDVTLQENITIGEGESLTIGKDASLTVPDGKTLTNNGTILVESGGTLTGEPTGDGTVISAPKITTESLPEGTVGTEYNQTLAATGNNITWSVTSGTLPAGLNLNGNTISGTPTAKETSTFTVTATNNAGSDSKELTLTVNQPVTGVTLDKTTLELIVGNSATLKAIVAPADATNNTVTWASNNTAIATVDENGKITAVAPGTATITATTEDGGKTATCTVTVTAKTYQIAVDKSTLDFGSMFAGNAVPGAQTVTITNKGNQTVTVTLPASTYYNVTAGTDFTDKQATLAPGGTATFTVQPKTGLAAGTYQETLTVSGDNGVQAALLCKLAVTAKTYSLSIDPGAIGFGTAAVGYTQPAVREVTVKNTGNQTLTLTHPTAVNFEVGKLNQLTLAPGEKAVFTVRPKAGLGAGSYSETVVVKANSGTQVSVNLTFTVQNGTTATPVTESRTLHFNTMGGLPMDDVKFGLGAPVELWPYTPVRTGYLFQGWYADEALTQPVSTIVLVKDTTIYAKWAVDPAAQAASGSGSGSSGSGSGGSGSGSKATPTPSPSPTPEPTATPTPTQEPTATPEPTPEVTPAPEETDKGGFPILPVAAGVVVLAALAGGIVWFRRR